MSTGNTTSSITPRTTRGAVAPLAVLVGAGFLLAVAPLLPWAQTPFFAASGLDLGGAVPSLLLIGPAIAIFGGLTHVHRVVFGLLAAIAGLASSAIGVTTLSTIGTEGEGFVGPAIGVLMAIGVGAIAAAAGLASALIRGRRQASHRAVGPERVAINVGQLDSSSS